MATGELIGAVAMTEPGTGSDLQAVRTTARRTDDGYVINGQKTFISNGQNAGVVVVVAKTDTNAAGAQGISLLVVETDEVEGFRRGRNLHKESGREHVCTPVTNAHLVCRLMLEYKKRPDGSTINTAHV